MRIERITLRQIRMPLVVIGGGLTAVDTATESLAYYVVQVEKFTKRYETLVAEKGETEVRAGWSNYAYGHSIYTNEQQILRIRAAIAHQRTASPPAVSTTDRVSPRGWSGSRPRASAARTAQRCA